MGTKIYFCEKCKKNHRFTSKIGTQHIEYSTQASVLKKEPKDKVKKIPPNKITEMEKKSTRSTSFITDYLTSYRNGVEKFGIWWKIFQLSVWGLAVILLLTAAIIFIVYLPRIEMILW
jgi:hypothetical protein